MVYWYFGWCFRESFFQFRASVSYSITVCDTFLVFEMVYLIFEMVYLVFYGIFGIWVGIFDIWYLQCLKFIIQWSSPFNNTMMIKTMIMVDAFEAPESAALQFGPSSYSSPCLLFICPVNLALVCSKVVQWRCKTLHLLPNSEEWHPEQAWKHPRARGAGHIPPGATERRQDRAHNCTRRPTAVTGCAQPQSLPVCSW